LDIYFVKKKVNKEEPREKELLKRGRNPGKAKSIENQVDEAHKFTARKDFSDKGTRGMYRSRKIRKKGSQRQTCRVISKKGKSQFNVPPARTEGGARRFS